jgi:two-component system phosphate regulon response regulator PhoB
MSGETVVVIEDEPDIREVITLQLGRDGFRVSESSDGREGLDLVRRLRPDVVLLDVMLPGMDGIEVCKALKADAETRSIPVIMVTARDDETDVVLGLGVGADDYVKKPFGTKELVARVKAVLRRGRPTEQPGAAQRLVRGPITIDPGRHEVTIDGGTEHFTAAEFRLLHHLATHPGRVFTRDQLIPRISGEDAIVTSRTVDVHVRALRRKLDAHSDLIETIRGVGYRFRDVGR